MTDDLQVRGSVACGSRRRNRLEAIVPLGCLPLISVLKHNNKNAILGESSRG